MAGLSGVHVPRRVRDRLREARALCEAGLSHGVNARDAHGDVVGITSPAAVAFDPSGALFRVTREDPVAILDLAARMLSEATGGDCTAPTPHRWIHEWSDRASLSDVLAAFDRAIELVGDVDSRGRAESKRGRGAPKFVGACTPTFAMAADAYERAMATYLTEP